VVGGIDPQSPHYHGDWLADHRNVTFHYPEMHPDKAKHCQEKSRRHSRRHPGWSRQSNLATISAACASLRRRGSRSMAPRRSQPGDTHRKSARVRAGAASVCAARRRRRTWSRARAEPSPTTLSRLSGRRQPLPLCARRSSTRPRLSSEIQCSSSTKPRLVTAIGS
jgi:hypothetical protein